MENSYGIGVTNRYELFYVDEEGSDPLETLIQIKQKTNKKVETGKLSQGITQPGQQINKSAEKENKSAILNKNQTQDQLTKSARPAGNLNKKTVKENQTVPESKGKVSRDDTKPKDSKPTDRPDRSSNKTDSEIRELRNNKRNRDERQSNGQEQQLNQNRDDRPPRRGNFNGERRGGGGGDRGGLQRGENRGENRGGQRYDERRGKREFDRQSGSDKTGVKAVDKRDGAGAHNWGTHKQDLEDLNKSVDENDKDKDESSSNEQKETDTEPAAPVEEEAKELTLDEWKAQRAVRAKPQFNIRKAGEGEDTSQWKKMVALDNKKKEDDDEELEYDPSMYPQRVGRQKHVLDIEFHFNDARRGGGGGIGRGGRGGRGRGGPGGSRGGPGGQRRNADRPERTANADVEREAGAEEQQPEKPQQQVRPAREQREPREPRGPRREHATRNFDDRFAARNSQNAPKVDDEHDFPSLG